jgi:hypothetical protein
MNELKKKKTFKENPKLLFQASTYIYFYSTPAEPDLKYR